MNNNPSPAQPNATSRFCTRCTGSGKSEVLDKHACYACRGRGYFEPIDVRTILPSIAGRKGLRSKRPDGDRAYYVWRMARFHGGMDVTMPMCAMTCISGDPYRPELDALSEAVAQRAFGTHMAAAYRWAGLLSTGSVATPAGLPATAYPGGPVLLGEKPEEEILELAG